MKKVIETLDYILFENEVVNKIRSWESQDLKKPSSKFANLNSIYKKQQLGVQLWGEAGTGKTTYLNFLYERLTKKYNMKIIKIKNEIEVTFKGIFILDATNEISKYNESDLIKNIKKNKAFIITSSWFKSNSFNIVEINPSEETLEDRNWKELPIILRNTIFQLEKRL